MATSSSDSGSCAAPGDFQLSAELDENLGDIHHDDHQPRLGVDLLKCPLCCNARKNFYCSQCIKNGDFMPSSSVYLERFADKQLRLLRIEASKDKVEDKCTQLLEKHRHRDKIICDIKACKERIRILQHMENDTRQSITTGNQRLDQLKDINSQIVSRLPRHEERVEKMRRLLINQTKKQEKHKDSMERKRYQLKKVIVTSTKQLVKYIFPLGKVEPNNSEEETANSDTVTSALADASGTSYVRGKWINDVENSEKVYYSIVAPTLPGSGDYSAYSLWVAENKDRLPGGNKENAMHNHAYNINAALTYTTQLVNILAYYVHVKLPYKLEYNEFCENELSDKKFARKVARLNSNILHLCFTQKTDTSFLVPMHTLQNLMHLLNPEVTDLGRIGPIEVDSHEIERLHNPLIPDLENTDDSASDEEEDAINWEWEAVPNIACPEMAVPIPGALLSQQSSSMQVNQSVAGGLVTSAAASIASFWRGWTANR